jgi:DNA-binding NarL/FixJ family response regulator
MESTRPLSPALSGPDAAIRNRAGVVLIDHQLSFSDAVRRCVPPSAPIEIVATPATAEEAIPLIRSLRPRVVVTELNGSTAGLQTLLQLPEVRLKEIAVAVLTDGIPDRLLDHVVHLNVSCLSKCDPLDELLVSLCALARGDRIYSSGIRLRLDAAAGPEGPHIVRQRSRLSELSERQLQVLQYLAQGRRVKDVAQAMHLSEKAVESHKYRIMNQLNIHDRVELCLYAIREGLISL